MGYYSCAYDFEGTFVSSNPKVDIHNLESDYPGIRNVKFSKSELPFAYKSKKWNEWFAKKQDSTGINEGFIVKIKDLGFNIYTTKYTKWFGCNELLYKGLRSKVKTHACLCKPIFRNGNIVDYEVLAKGTLAYCKEKAHKILYDNDYSFVLHLFHFTAKEPGYYLCGGEVKTVKTTKRVSDGKYKVIPVAEYYFYGVGRDTRYE